MEQEAQVRLEIANMFAISADVRVATLRNALDLPGLSPPMRAAHLASLAYNLLVAGRLAEAKLAVPEARAALAVTGDLRASLTIRVIEAGIAYAEEQFADSLELFTSTARECLTAGENNTLSHMIHMFCGEIQVNLDREAEAFAIAKEGVAACQRDRQGFGYEMYEVWQARLHLRFGRISESAAILEGRFELEDGTRAVAALDGAGLCAMARAAMHMGDTRQLRRAAEIAKVMLKHGTPANQRHAAWMLMRAAWDARRVRSRLRDLGIHRRLVLREPATNGWSAMTAPEASVAELVAEGPTNREVAERLFLSPHRQQPPATRLHQARH